MRFQSQLGQTKVVFNNQGKNAPQCNAFRLEIFLFKIEIAFGKKLKRHVARSLKRRQCFAFVPRLLLFLFFLKNFLSTKIVLEAMLLKICCLKKDKSSHNFLVSALLQLSS
jgi:hypothetical protein